MNVPWVCYTCHALLYGGVGLAYRAWNSVVFLLLTGIAKPLTSVKNERTSRFLCAKKIITKILKYESKVFNSNCIKLHGNGRLSRQLPGKQWKWQ